MSPHDDYTCKTATELSRLAAEQLEAHAWFEYLEACYSPAKHPDQGESAPVAFASHRTKTLRPLKSGGAEIMIAEINAAIARYKAGVMEYDAMMKQSSWALAEMGLDSPASLYTRAMQELKEIGVGIGEAHKYLQHSLKRKR